MSRKKCILFFFVVFALSLEPRALSQAHAADKGADPALHLRFDEGGGPTAYDDSSNNNDGTPNAGGSGDNDANSEMWQRQGKIGGAMDFDGTNDIVTVTHHSSLNFATEDAFTISFWMSVDALPTDSVGVIVKNGYGYDYRIRLYPSGKLQTQSSNGTLGIQPYSFTTNATFSTDGAWNHCVLVYDGSADKRYWYVNGTLDNSEDTTGALENSTSNLVLGQGASAEYFNGRLDELKIYNYARTPEQILTDYNASTATHSGTGTDPNEGNPPVAYYKFDENTGTTAYDRSGNGNDGTLGGDGAGDDVPTWTQGKSGPALSYDGGDYIAIGAGNFDTLTNATVECWFYYTGTFDQNRMLFNRRKDSTNRSPIFIGYPAGHGNKLVFENIVAGSNRAIKSNDDIAPNVWYHAAFISGTNGMKMYLNGVQQTQTNATTDSFSAIAATVMNDIGSNNGAAFFNGIIDEFKIYDYERTAAQIAYDYNKGKPIAYYKFDEGGGTIAHNSMRAADEGAAPVSWWRMDNDWTDSSGNSNTLTASGATFSSTAKIGDYCGLFNGTGDYAYLGSDTTFSTDAWTVSCWFNADKMPETVGVADIQNFTDTEQNVNLQYWSIRGQKIALWDVSNGAWYSANTTLSQDTWYHTALVYDGSGNYDVYVNGVLDDSWANFGTTDDTCSIKYIGARNGNERYFYGEIDDFRVYDYARTPEQIYSDYKNTHGTIIGDTSFVDGKIGKALEFDGTGDYVMIPSASQFNENLSQITMSCWVETSASGYTHILSRGAGWSAGNVILYTDGSTEFRFTVNGYSTSANSGVAPSGEWQHLVGTYDGTQSSNNMRIYVDGMLKDTGTADLGTLADRSDAFYIASRGDSQFTSGVIDDVRIYNYVRTAEQVLQDYNAGMATHTGVNTGTADPWGGALPVAHWKMDDNTGVLCKDASGNGNDGTIPSASANQPGWTQGKKGPCLQFDSDSNDYVDCGFDSVYDGSAITVEAWVYPDTTGPSSDTDRIVSRDRSDYWMLGQDTSNGIEWAVYAGGGIKYLFPPADSLTTGEWNFLAATFDCADGDQKVYVNGVEVDSTNVGALGGVIGKGNDRSLAIGTNVEATPSGNLGFKGKIDDVKIYNYARTPAQIAWDYKKGKPVAHYRLDEATSGAVSTTAGAIKDDSGRYNGTASNTTWSYTTGKSGGALSFDGNDYVDCGSDIPESKERTYTWWHKIGANGSAEFPSPISYGGYGNGFRAIWRDDTDDKMDIQITCGADTTPTVILESPSVDSPGVWYHYAFTYDGVNTGNLYRNGILVDTDTGGTGEIKAAVSSFMIGQAQYYWVGEVDEVRAYNYVRTAEQVLQDYNEGMAARLGD